MREKPLPPGQVEHDTFPRFGLMAFSHRYPDAPDQLELVVKGDVASPFSLSGEELGKLYREERVADFHCVTTWSVRGVRWSGFLFRDFYEKFVEPRARPKPDARLVVLRCQDGYSASLPLEDLLADDVLLADRLDGRPLDMAHGAPLRLVAPAHYGFKNAKHLRGIEFWRDARKYKFPGPRLMDHPRGRVAEQERAGGLPNWLARFLYRRLIGPVTSRFRKGLERYEADQRRAAEAEAARRAEEEAAAAAAAAAEDDGQLRL
ncbi:MAG: molybdopterin-dependent oxidoreductase [Myxococcota bacterium]